MARRARVAITDYPHHVTHRGNLRAQVFFSDDDRLFIWGCWSTAAFAQRTLLDAGRPFPGAYNDWATYLAGGVSDPDIDKLRWCTSTGRPFGSEEFLRACEEEAGRILRPIMPGPKVSPSASTDLS